MYIVIMTLSIILIYLAEKNYTYSNLLDIKSGYRGLRVLPNKVHFVNKMRILLINNKYYTLYVHRPQIQCLCGVSENQEILAFFSNFTFSKAQRTHVHIIYMSKFTYLACSRNVFFLNRTRRKIYGA